MAVNHPQSSPESVSATRPFPRSIYFFLPFFSKTNLLHVLPSPGMTISMLILSVYSTFGQHLPFAGWMTTAFLLIYIITSTFGFLTIPFTMLPEMFPQRVRGLTAGITVCLAYLLSFTAIKLYPSMLSWMGNGMVFLFYGIVSLFGTFFVHFILPETKGKSLQEIENLFKKTSQSSLKV